MCSQKISPYFHPWVSGASIIALAGLPVQVGYDPPIYFFSQVQLQFRPYSFLFHSIFHNLRCSAIQLLLFVLKVTCLLMIFKLIISLHFWIFSGFL